MFELTITQRNKIKEIIGKCEICSWNQEPKSLHVHRIKRANQGGKYTLRNIEIVCDTCHVRIHGNELGCGK